MTNNEKLVWRLTGELQTAINEWKSGKWNAEEWLERFKAILKWYPVK